MTDRLTVLLLQIRSLFSQDEGQGLVEYSLILALIAVAAIVALTMLGGSGSSALNSIGNNVPGT